MELSHILHEALRAYYKAGIRGFYTLNRLLNAGYPELTVRNSFGARFQLHPAKYIDSVVLREGYYESEVIEALSNFVSAGDVFWDVGSNFGLHGITLKTLCPNLITCLIEPLPEMRQRCEVNARLNNVEVNILEGGLYDTNEVLTLHTDQTRSEGESSFIDHGRSKLSLKTSAHVYRGDELIKSGRVPAPQILKIDIEGAEYRALLGFGEYLSAPHLKAIVFEAPSSLLGEETSLKNILLENGFTLEKLTRREDTGHSLSNFLAFK